ncbi:hypothetical protein BSF41_01490 [Flavobacterium sp. ACN2]|nr:hypothetical protein BSF41_01490 [Flavobacterium sp. ACN2]
MLDSEIKKRLPLWAIFFKSKMGIVKVYFDNRMEL